MNLEDLSLCNLEKAIVTFSDERNFICLKFSYTFLNGSSKIFTLNRAANEKVSSLIARIKNNLAKFLCPKKGGNKRSKDDTSAISVHFLKCLDKYDGEVPDHKRLNLIVESSQDLCCSDIFFSTENQYLLYLDNVLFYFIYNPPAVLSASLPTNIMAGYYLHPNNLKVIHADIEHSSYKWFFSSQTFENYCKVKENNTGLTWENIYDGFVLHVTEEMIGRLIKVDITPKDKNREGETFETVSQTLVSAAPHTICPYQIRQKETSSFLPDHSLRVVSYNLLAEVYSTREHSADVLYPYCESYALDMAYRKQLLISELFGYNADVLCLQEVDEHVYEHDLSKVLPALTQGTLQGCFAAKGDGKIKEGSAIFYNMKKLKFIHAEDLQLNKELENNSALENIRNIVKQNEALWTTFSTRTTIVHVCSFEVLHPNSSQSKTLLVANTHFYFHPDADHIRLLQSVASVLLLEQKIQQLKNEGSSDVSVIFCGDFNSTPDTGVYELLTTGAVHSTHPGWSSLPEEAIDGISASHDLHMSSACGTPQYTNYIESFSGCLDYIFYQPKKFKLEKVIPLPIHEQVTSHTALPSPVIPSDHLALVAELSYI